MLITVGSYDDIHAIRRWLEGNVCPGREVKTWKSSINEEIVYQAKDGFSWTMTYRYFNSTNIEINGLNSETEILLRLSVNSA